MSLITYKAYKIKNEHTDKKRNDKCQDRILFLNKISHFKPMHGVKFKNIGPVSHKELRLSQN